MWSAQLSKGKETSKIRSRIIEWTFGKGLDLGCGTDKIHQDAIGIDIVPFPGVSYLLDVRDLYIFSNKSFDYVYSSHTLEDLEDTEDALREWLRVLKPTGYLMLYLPHKNFYPNIGKPGSNPAHKHDFLPSDILKAIKAVSHCSLILQEKRAENSEYSFLSIFQKL